MRIVNHDYSGHMFPESLSRSLAQRGHDVLHLFSGSFLSPHGNLVTLPDDPAGLAIEPITLPQMVDKTNLFKRRQADIAHGKLLVERLRAFRPDVVITGNTPLEIVAATQDYCAESGAKHLFWVQDLIGIAAKKLVRKKLPIVGGFIGDRYVEFERRLLRKAWQVVVISDDFRPFVPPEQTRVTTVENWAPLADMPEMPKVNSWSEAQGLAETFNFVYTGTLGMKHNPGLLVRLAEEFRSDPKVRIVVCSAGASMEWLASEKAARNLSNLILLPFQPLEDFPKVLGAADVVVGILEPDAGVFCVPSKVLSYLCSGRPILLAVPGENLIARIVTGHDAGVVVNPSDEAAVVAAAKAFRSDETRRREMGCRGRAYAEATFDLARITDRFEELLSQP